MRPWKPSVIVVARNVDIVALGCRLTSGLSRRHATQHGPASWRHAPTTSGRNCSKRLATSDPHGALRSHCCIADKRLSTMTRNARTLSASLVRSSSTRWDASGTTSRQCYSSPAPGCSLHDRIPGPELSDFQPVTIDEVRKLLASIPRKTSPLDVLPVSRLKDCVDVFAPAITTLANLSFQTGKFPSRFKSAQVQPLLLKAGLDRSLSVN